MPYYNDNAKEAHKWLRTAVTGLESYTNKDDPRGIYVTSLLSIAHSLLAIQEELQEMRMTYQEIHK